MFKHMDNEYLWNKQYIMTTWHELNIRKKCFEYTTVRTVIETNNRATLKTKWRPPKA